MNVDTVRNRQVNEVKAYVESTKDGLFYMVTKINDIWECTCPQSRYKKLECKHIKAVVKETA